MQRALLDHPALVEKVALPKERMWRLATEGEANLILVRIDIAVERYQNALDGPPKPDPWQFTSTSRQALRIADHFGETQIVNALLTVFTGGEP